MPAWSLEPQAFKAKSAVLSVTWFVVFDRTCVLCVCVCVCVCVNDPLASAVVCHTSAFEASAESSAARPASSELFLPNFPAAKPPDP